VLDPPPDKRDDGVSATAGAGKRGGSAVHGRLAGAPSTRRSRATSRLGVVEEVGADVTHINSDDGVVIPFNISCDHCCCHGVHGAVRGRAGPPSSELDPYAALAAREQIPLDPLRDEVAQFPTYGEGWLKGIERFA
jgi:hypothetical protein